jgi:hypothetical protein
MATTVLGKRSRTAIDLEGKLVFPQVSLSPSANSSLSKNHCLCDLGASAVRALLEFTKKMNLHLLYQQPAADQGL